MLARLIPSSRTRHQAASVLVAFVVTILLAYLTPLLDQAEIRAQDLVIKKTASSVDPSLVLLAIDDISLNLSAQQTPVSPEEMAQSRALQLMQPGFPWSREVYALAADQLFAAGAKVVILDTRFPNPRAGDDALAAALRAHGHQIVFASNFDHTDVSGHGNLAWIYIPPTPELAAAAPQSVGYANLDFSFDGVVRSFPPYATASSFNEGSYGSDTPLPALSTAAARTLGFAPPLTSDPESLRFRYLQPDAISTYSLYQIFVSKIWQKTFHDGAFFKDKIVMIGATAAILQDAHDTPFGIMPGPKIQLNILSAMRRGQWLHTAPHAAYLAATILSCLLVLLISLRRQNVIHLILSCVGLIFLSLGVFWAAFAWTNWFLPIAHPLVALILSSIGVLASDVTLERNMRGRLRSTLDRYVSKDIVREIVENPTSYLQTLGGQRKEVVVLFSDLKGFTSDAEHMDPSEMVALLNEYFTEMVEAVFVERGTLDKFLGDALMATWGGLGAASMADNAQCALRAALEMKKRLAALNARRQEKGIAAWASGTGICLGPAVFGNIGSPHKMDLTVIGDTVNLTSRIEGLTRIYGCDLLIDERVAAHATDCELLLIDIVRVKGRRGHESLFYPYQQPDPEWATRYQEARLKYLAQDFATARAEFDTLAVGGIAPRVAACYRDRCEAFLLKPPAEDWDGIWSFTEK